MPQLLHLQNGETVVQKVRSGDGRLAALLKVHKDDAKVTEELFLATLSRLPTAKELAVVKAQLADGGREEVFRDLFWALMNSKEFSFNH